MEDTIIAKFIVSRMYVHFLIFSVSLPSYLIKRLSALKLRSQCKLNVEANECKCLVLITVLHDMTCRAINIFSSVNCAICPDEKYLGDRLHSLYRAITWHYLLTSISSNTYEFHCRKEHTPNKASKRWRSKNVSNFNCESNAFAMSADKKREEKSVKERSLSVVLWEQREL